MLRLSRYGCLFLASLAMLSLPSAGADDGASGLGCVNVGIDHMGDGVGAYVLTQANAVGLSVASGIPGDGMTLTFIVVPSVCAGNSVPPLDTSTIFSTAESVPRAPALP